MSVTHNAHNTTSTVHFTDPSILDCAWPSGVHTSRQSLLRRKSHFTRQHQRYVYSIFFPQLILWLQLKFMVKL